MEEPKKRESKEDEEKTMGYKQGGDTDKTDTTQNNARCHHNYSQIMRRIEHARHRQSNI